MKTRISGMVCTTPPQYLLSSNPFSLMDEFEKWFWFECETKFNNRHWFAVAEIPLHRCGWR